MECRAEHRERPGGPLRKGRDGRCRRAPAKIGLTCTNGAVAQFNQDGFTSYVTVEACSVAIFAYKRCLAINVNKPL